MIPDKLFKGRFQEEAILAGGAFIGFLLLGWRFLRNMASIWWNNDTFSHCLLVPFIALGLFWMNFKNSTSQAAGEPIDFSGQNYGGFLLLFIACAMALAGTNSEVLFIGGLAIVAAAGAVLWIFMGKGIFQRSLPALGMLLFMIPVPPIILDRMTFPMKNLVASVSTKFLILLGAPVFLDGNVIHLPSFQLAVADECSGIRSLFALAAFAYAFAALFVKGTLQKIVTFLSVFVTSVLANIFRILLTAVISLYISNKIADGFLHEISGVFAFMLAALMTMFVSFLIREKR